MNIRAFPLAESKKLPARSLVGRCENHASLYALEALEGLSLEGGREGGREGGLLPPTPLSINK